LTDSGCRGWGSPVAARLILRRTGPSVMLAASSQVCRDVIVVDTLDRLGLTVRDTLNP
jgi:hypothetical protein